jgi:hypothetical protein
MTYPAKKLFSRYSAPSIPTHIPVTVQRLLSLVKSPFVETILALNPQNLG